MFTTLRQETRKTYAPSIVLPGACEAADSVHVLASSSQLHWSGIYMERACISDMHFDDLALGQHHLAMPVKGSEITLVESRVLGSKHGNVLKKQELVPGQICIYPAQTPISKRMASVAEFIFLFLEPSRLFESIFDVLVKANVELPLHQNLDDPRLRLLLQLMMAELEGGNPNGQLFHESLITALCVHLVNNYSLQKKRLSGYRNGLSRRKLKQVTDYIAAHLSEDISLESLACEAGISRFHFLRLFKQSTNLTPHQYLLLRRLESARELLKQGELSGTEISYALGFSDQSHFIRLFKKHYGVSPSTYLRK